MTNEEVEFVKAITIFSGLVKFELTDDIGWFYVESLRQFGLEKARQALMKLARSAKVGRGLPSVDEILEIIAPQEVAEIEAVDDAAVAAGRIWETIGRFGSQKTGPEGDVFKRQREHIGEAGWSVVGRQWQRICDETRTDDMATLKAQWRMEVKGAISRAKAMLPAAPGLPGGLKAEALLPAAPPPMNPAVQTLIDGAVLDVSPDVLSSERRKAVVEMDRKRVAAGEREDEGQDPW